MLTPNVVRSISSSALVGMFPRPNCSNLAAHLPPSGLPVMCTLVSPQSHRGHLMPEVGWFYACLEFVCWSANFDNRQDLLEVSADEDSQATKQFFTVANVTKGSVESLQPSLVRHGNLILSSFFLWKSHFFSGSNAFSQKIMNSSKFLNIYFVTLHTVLNSTCGQRDMKWAPLRHISDLERPKMTKMSSGTLIAFTWYHVYAKKYISG